MRRIAHRVVKPLQTSKKCSAVKTCEKKRSGARRRKAWTTWKSSSAAWPSEVQQANLSFFAFTATPKHKTLAVFGRNGEPVPPLYDATSH